MKRISTTRVFLFDEVEAGRAAIEALRREGVPADELGVITHDETGRLVTELAPASHTEPLDPIQTRTFFERAAANGAKGAVVGGLIGLLGGLAALALPGVTAVLFLGSAAGVFTAAGAGALTAGVFSALATHMVDEVEATVLEEAVRRGGTLVFVHGETAGRPDLAERMARLGAVDLERRVSTWRAAGWTGYTPPTVPVEAVEPEEPREELFQEEDLEGVDPWVARHWHKLKGPILAQWPRLTPEDLERVAGHRGHLVHRVRELYGDNLETVNWLLDELLARELGTEAIQLSPTAQQVLANLNEPR